jgi:3-deoxy-D-manno-octulosonate 8-phosphate phosphatase KdsC-like HAD superfamily phosphatase/dTDP-glucose pyrophosphorylase/galactose mutarotase-like enzyme
MLHSDKMNFVLDIDGVMTTGQFLYSQEGKAFKIFGPHDADGLKMLHDKMNIYFVTADKRGFEISKKRINDMGYPIDLVTEHDRHTYVKEKFGFENTVFMGDGIFDAKVIKDCKFGIAPQNARREAKDTANFVTDSNSAEGAVCDAAIEINRRFFEGKENDEMITLSCEKVKVSVYNGKICSIKKGGEEFMHGSSKPHNLQNIEDKKGWNKSEIVMFPTIGAMNEFHTNLNGFKVPLDQHGLARNIPFKVHSKKSNYLKLIQKYSSNTLIKNQKFEAENGHPKFLSWPFSFVLEKEIEIIDDHVYIRFSIENKSQQEMPFMLGWHPAFKILKEGEFSIADKKFSLNDVLEGSKQIALFAQGDTLEYSNGKKKIVVNAKGFGKMILWSPGRETGMCCIEPVTHLPEPSKSKHYFESKDKQVLQPKQRKTFSIDIFVSKQSGPYKVCILAAGVGSRMGHFTRTFNKALIPIEGKPTICHIIEKFHESVEIIVAIGYKGEQIKDYLITSYPHRKISFIEIENYDGVGSGPGKSLLQCKPVLKCPFIFFAADTLVREEIPPPTENWFGLAEVKNTSRFCSAQIMSEKVVRIDDKIECDNKYAFIGLAGVYDFKHFWRALENNRNLIEGEIQFSNGFTLLIEKDLNAKKFTWFDVGTPSAYDFARKNFVNGSSYKGE